MPEDKTSSAERKAVGFVELLTQDPELSGLRTDYAQKPASERRKAAEWAYDESLATSLFGAAMARVHAGELPSPKWPPGFASLAIDPEFAPALLTVGCYELAQRQFGAERLRLGVDRVGAF